ncbi:MAG TPA: hypothetical protein VD996_18380 [Chitinophagaceae bacterium]|nr:hypothetical protein [Chitinophagaceae bacterium]
MRLLLILLAVTLMACRQQSDIRNDISIQSNGLTVKQAFLMFQADGKLVPEGNKVEVGQQVNMRLLVDGWEAKNGKVFIGASEKITTDEGQVVLDEADLFANYAATGIDAADAGVITLSAVITRVDKLFKYFEVSFRVWDKNSSDNITGSYRLYLK